MKQWIPNNPDLHTESLPEPGELFIFGDNINNEIGLAVYDEMEDSTSMITMDMDSMQIDTEITHFIRIPKLPPNE
jgi:alpha-tubulin suppressor-like RCC1 family protein